MAGRSGRKHMKVDQDFQEGDVWGLSVVEERENSIKPKPKSMMMMMIKESSLSCPASTCPRMIPRTSSSSSYTNEACSKQQFSAPLDIPDWSKIYGNKISKKKMGMNVISPSSSSSSWVEVVSHGDDGYYHDEDEGHVDDDDDGGGMVPPHEYIARKLARTQISVFSVCEGVGRTLKGRDLRKVRNAILTRTGFLE